MARPIVWREIPRLRGHCTKCPRLNKKCSGYQYSADGRIRHGTYVLRPFLLGGHPYVFVDSVAFPVDELVADEAPKPHGPRWVKHRDGRPLNVALDNLVWLPLGQFDRLAILIREMPAGTPWGAGDYSPGAHGFTLKKAS